MSASRIAILLLLVFALEVSGVAIVCAPHPCCMAGIQDDCGEMQMDVADCPMCDQAAKAPQAAVVLQTSAKWSVLRVESPTPALLAVNAATYFSPTFAIVHRAPLTTVLRI